MIRRNSKSFDFKSVGQIIPRAIKHLSKAPEYKFYLIKFYWENIVGKEIAAHAIPKNFAFGVLYIGTSSSVWANNLLYMKYDILNKINTILKYKIIKDIKFTYGKAGSNKEIPVKILQKNDMKKLLSEINLTLAEQDSIDKCCRNIRDEELAKRIKKIMSTHKKIDKIKLMHDWHECKKCRSLCPAQEEYCDNCKRIRKSQEAVQIRKILMTKPWARYAEINRYVNCSREMVNDARTSLVQKLAADLNISSYDDIQVKTLVMLYRALPPEQINNKLVKENINKLKYDLKYDEMRKITKKGRIK
ncbi:DUF721 domain-containing protein [Pectinatus frisingensis]|jgi:hypothetical protein|uniref:DUF721 domain-containing protein n=1 Tax=Pectinatus frisingensis TaxID=865 RepID=UPI0015F4D7F6|nr:DUF721 domain-containing protein [Pectinatus frisingensis]